MESRSSLLVVLLLGVVTGRPADNGAPSISAGQGGVSASFGGYHASAGLGGSTGSGNAGGGLFAQAGTPDGAHAGAGLGGKTAGGATGGLYARAGLPDGAGAGAAGGGAGGLYAGGRTPVTKSKTGNGAVYYNVTTQKNQGFFNDIFNIPTSVLKAVNQFLNNNVNKQVITTASATPVATNKVGQANFKFQVNAGGGVGGQTPCVGTDCEKPDAGSHQVYAQKTVYKTASKEKADASATANANVATTVAKRPGFYDNVFNIPITALNAVNTFLNNFGR